jgi:hypothetical protein
MKTFAGWTFRALTFRCATLVGRLVSRGQTYRVQAGQTFVSGIQAGQTFIGGVQAGQTFVSGMQAGQTFIG